VGVARVRSVRVAVEAWSVFLFVLQMLTSSHETPARHVGSTTRHSGVAHSPPGERAARAGPGSGKSARSSQVTRSHGGSNGRPDTATRHTAQWRTARRRRHAASGRPACSRHGGADPRPHSCRKTKPANRRAQAPTGTHWRGSRRSGALGVRCSSWSVNVLGDPIQHGGQALACERAHRQHRDRPLLACAHQLGEPEEGAQRQVGQSLRAIALVEEQQCGLAVQLGVRKEVVPRPCSPQSIEATAAS
jgi:hypothetical protein